MSERTLSILLVDDDVALLATLAGQLEQAGYATIRASQVEQAETLYVEQQPDLILLEVDTGRGSGWTLLERVAPLTPVLVLSGLGLEEQIVRGFDLGAIDYLTKPYRRDELLARLRTRIRTLLPAPEAATLAVAAPQAQSASAPTFAVVAAPWVEHAGDPLPPTRPALAARPAEEEEPVFIDSISEARLLADSQAGAAAQPLDTADVSLPLGARLAAARRRRTLSLVQAENETGVRMWYIQAMEEEKFALLPRGAASEQIVQRYASYLGLDAQAALGEFRRMHYNPTVAPPTALGGTPTPRTLPRWPFLILAALLAVVITVVAIVLIDPLGVQRLLEQASSWLG